MFTGRIKPSIKIVDWLNKQNKKPIDIVTSGLILHLDSFNSQSYPGSGTVWRDISGVMGDVNVQNRSTDWSFAIEPSTSMPCLLNLTNRGTGNNPGINVPMNNGFNKMAGTIDIWIKPSGDHVGGHGFFNNSDGSTHTNATNWFWLGTWDTSNILYFRQGNSSTCCNDTILSSFRQVYYQLNEWNNFTFTWNVAAGRTTIYRNGKIVSRRTNMPTDIPNSHPTTTGQLFNGHSRSDNMQFKGYCSNYRIYNRELTNQEVEQNFKALQEKHFVPGSTYEVLDFTLSGNLFSTFNNTERVSVAKISGSGAWDNHAYVSAPFNAPVTLEFNKNAGVSSDNGVSYAMIGWNEDPLTNADYASVDYASYPYRQDNYQVYHNGGLVQNGGTWNSANKFYIVYDSDGFIRHYNGSKELYRVNYGTGKTVYVDSSFYSVDNDFSRFSNLKVRKSAWDGEKYENQIINTGLMLNLNASISQSHPGSGTTWNDLSSNNRTATLVNGVSYSSVNPKSLIFDGLNDYVISSGVVSQGWGWTPSGIGNNNLTLDIWFKSSDQGGFIISRPWNGSGNYNYTLSPTGFGLSVGTGFNLSFPSTICTGEWINITVAISSSQVAVYRNGEIFAGPSNHGITGNTPSGGTNDFGLVLMTLYPYGDGWGGIEGFSIQGNVGNVKGYNRFLSAQEIQQNFNSIRANYGI